MRRVRTIRALKLYLILCPIPWVLITIFDVVMLILGEETVMGNPILRTMWEMEPYSYSACLLLESTVALILTLIVVLREKKHPPKADKPLSGEDGRRPPSA